MISIAKIATLTTEEELEQASDFLVNEWQELLDRRSSADRRKKWKEVTKLTSLIANNEDLMRRLDDRRAELDFDKKEESNNPKGDKP